MPKALCVRKARCSCGIARAATQSRGEVGAITFQKKIQEIHTCSNQEITLEYGGM